MAFKSGLIGLAATILFLSPQNTLGAPDGAIPFYCFDIASTDSSANVDCWRADTGSKFTTVPTGLHMHVTDMYFYPNSLVTSGVARGFIGRDDGDPFPGRPSIDFLADLTQKFHFNTPYIILSPGQSLKIRNDSSSDFAVDVFASGYLSSDVSL